MHTTSNFQQPKAAVGALITHKNRVLLVKRGKAPSKGLWALPGGKIELGETMAQAAVREVLEETGVAIEISYVVCLFDSIIRNDQGAIDYHYIIIDFLAHPLNPETRLIPGDDAEDVKWVSVEALGDFPVTETTLNLIKQVMKGKES